MISIVGNTKLCETVENFITTNRIPHAILVEGEYGTGKHTLVNILAKACVCESEKRPCNNCDNCRLTNNSNHPDITVITPEDGKKTIVVDQIRHLRDEVFIKPHKSQKRIFIIDFADTMNANAQNALLKVLEEPPKTVMFILIAENKSSLLPTVISRCVTLSLTTPEQSIAFDYIKSKTDYKQELIIDALESEKNNIGRALNYLNGKHSSNTEAFANDFLKAAIDCDRYTMLKLTLQYQKKRVEADRFIKDLKLSVAKRIEKNPNSILAKPLMAIYDELYEFESALITNINLNLLFCNLTSKMTEIIRRNK